MQDETEQQEMTCDNKGPSVESDYYSSSDSDTEVYLYENNDERNIEPRLTVVNPTKNRKSLPWTSTTRKRKAEGSSYLPPTTLEIKSNIKKRKTLFSSNHSKITPPPTTSFNDLTKFTTGGLCPYWLVENVEGPSSYLYLIFRVMHGENLKAAFQKTKINVRLCLTAPSPNLLMKQIIHQEKLESKSFFGAEESPFTNALISQHVDQNHLTQQFTIHLKAEIVPLSGFIKKVVTVDYIVYRIPLAASFLADDGGNFF